MSQPIDKIQFEVRYRDKLYGFSLGAFIIDVAKILGSIHPKLSNFDYEKRLARARAMMQALLVCIPSDTLGINATELIDKVNYMNRSELLKLMLDITNKLDRKGLLIRKRVRRRVVAEDVIS